LDEKPLASPGALLFVFYDLPFRFVTGASSKWHGTIQNGDAICAPSDLQNRKMAGCPRFRLWRKLAWKDKYR
jgi:hypothetical protein